MVLAAKKRLAKVILVQCLVVAHQWKKFVMLKRNLKVVAAVDAVVRA